jgi:hypothetical protein
MRLYVKGCSVRPRAGTASPIRCGGHLHPSASPYKTGALIYKQVRHHHHNDGDAPQDDQKSATRV